MSALVFSLYAPLATAAEFDHSQSLLTRVLSGHVKRARVDYAGLKAQPQELILYLEQVSVVTKTEFKKWREPQQIAFLINTYNASTLQLITDHYPLKSINDIGSLIHGPWDQRVVRLFGNTITLNTLEHKILRQDYAEPRLHFALVCAAKGCPPLRDEAYVGTRLNEQLDDQAKQFLAAPTKNRIEPDERVVYLSPIFKWYGRDFEKKSGSVLAALKPYWPEKAAALGVEKFEIRYTDYDWSLNEQEK